MKIVTVGCSTSSEQFQSTHTTVYY